MWLNHPLRARKDPVSAESSCTCILVSVKNRKNCLFFTFCYNSLFLLGRQQTACSSCLGVYNLIEVIASIFVGNNLQRGEVVVAQLVERSLPTPEVRSSNQVIGKI